MQREPLPVNLLRIRRLLFAAFAGIELALLCNSLALTTRPGLTSALIWIIQSLPLLPFLPGLLQNRIRTHAWLGFVSLIYFIHGVLLAFTPARSLIGIAESLCALLLFGSLILFIRCYRVHFSVTL